MKGILFKKELKPVYLSPIAVVEMIIDFMA